MIDGWRHADFRECVEEIRSGKSVNSIEEPANSDQIGVLKTSCVYNGRFEPRENKLVIPEEQYLVKCPVTAGTIIVSRMNTADLVGASGYVDRDYPNIFLPDRLWAVFPKQGIDPVWLYYVTSSPEIRARLSDNASGTSASMKNISQDVFLSMPTRIPPLQEQCKIAEILRTWDEAIEKLEALRAANLQRRIWMRSHLFTGRTRLPGYTGEWCEVALGEVLTEHGLKGAGAEEVFSVSVHKGLINQIEHLGRSFAAAETSHYNRVLPGDIVYTKSPTGDFPLGIIKQNKISAEVIVSPLYGVFTPATRALGVILDALFESPIAVRNYLHPLVQKGAKNTIAITNRRFLEGKLTLPMNPAEQSAIAAVVEVSQAELTAIESGIEALTRQKRGLMQKLLTGEWRVAV